MKYIRLYEKINGPDVGDYVLLEDDYDNKIVDNFIMTNIGQIIAFQIGWDSNDIVYKKSEIKGLNVYYLVEYDEIPEEVMNVAYPYLGKTIGEDYVFNILPVQKIQISDYSSNREDLETILQAKKYNL